MTEPASGEIKCPKCGAAMRIARRVPHAARPGYERQTLECTHCDYATLRTVDETGRPAR